jgi:hypothetical protein
MGPRNTVVYNSLPLSDLEECQQPLKRQSGFAAIQNWKFVALLSIAITICTLWTSYFRPDLLSPYTLGSYECHLESEKLWGQPIGWEKILLNSQQEFIDSDPWDSKYGQHGTSSGSPSTSPWDTLFYSTWVALKNDPASKGYGFGTPLTGPDSAGNDQDPIPWKEGSQAFGIRFMHQLHCVVLLKKAINDYRSTGGSRVSDNGTYSHLDHCLEVLRQATMCYGDTSLIRPDVPGEVYTGYTGWGNEHLCRDWEYVPFQVQYSSSRSNQVARKQ